MVTNPITRRNGLKTWCMEEFCSNTFLSKNIAHKFCDECALERKRLVDRNYYSRLTEAKRRHKLDLDNKNSKLRRST